MCIYIVIHAFTHILMSTMNVSKYLHLRGSISIYLQSICIPKDRKIDRLIDRMRNRNINREKIEIEIEVGKKGREIRRLASVFCGCSGDTSLVLAKLRLYCLSWTDFSLGCPCHSLPPPLLIHLICVDSLCL